MCDSEAWKMRRFWRVVQMLLSSSTGGGLHRGGEESVKSGHQLACARPAVAISAAPVDDWDSFILHHIFVNEHVSRVYVGRTGHLWGQSTKRMQQTFGELKHGLYRCAMCRSVLFIRFLQLHSTLNAKQLQYNTEPFVWTEKSDYDTTRYP